MEEGESIIQAIYEEDDFEDVEDVEMFDVEEGEIVGEKSPEVGKGGANDVSIGNQGSQSKNRRRRANKKKNKKKRSGSAPVTDINRFVLDTCRRLKEKKSYMVYAAVGCLGISALSDLVSEVNAVQSCGGQKTADGKRYRTGGGVLWNIIKSREPKAYKEIIKKTKDFEKQFRQQNIRQTSAQTKEVSSQVNGNGVIDEVPGSTLDDSELIPHSEPQSSNAEGERKSVQDRMRLPVSYDDLHDDEALKKI